MSRAWNQFHLCHYAFNNVHLWFSFVILHPYKLFTIIATIITSHRYTQGLSVATDPFKCDFNVKRSSPPDTPRVWFIHNNAPSNMMIIDSVIYFVMYYTYTMIMLYCSCHLLLFLRLKSTRFVLHGEIFQNIRLNTFPSIVTTYAV